MKDRVGFLSGLICATLLLVQLLTTTAVAAPLGLRHDALGCYAKNEIVRTYIPAPETTSVQDFQGPTAQIGVQFIGPWPWDAQVAFNYAADIWENLLVSPIPIHIAAYWEPGEGNNLARCSPGMFLAWDYNGCTCGYPLALANKMWGQDLAPSTPDMSIWFNSSRTDWNYRTDGTFTTGGLYDLASTALHEMGHGLGITGSMTVYDGKGYYGRDAYLPGSMWPVGAPTIYDYFAIRPDGMQLVNGDVVDNGSQGLAFLLTCNAIYWGGAIGTHENDDASPRLYAPSSWDPGSSFAHLDEADFPGGTANSLMTPFLGQYEANHDPGPIAMGVLRDIGWSEDTFSCQPDLMIHEVGKPLYLGDDVYDDWSTSQVVSRLGGGSKPAIYQIRLENDGSVPMKFSVRAITGPNVAFIRVYDDLTGGNEITNLALTSTGHITNELLPGQITHFRLEVQIGPSQPGGTEAEVGIVARPTRNLAWYLDVVKAMTVRATGQPDLLIGAQGVRGFIGNQVYDTFVNQTVSLSRASGEEAIYRFRLENDGQMPDDFTVTCASEYGATPTFYDQPAGGMNISPQVLGAGWIVTLNPGERKDFRAEVSLEQIVTPGQSRTTVVRAASSVDSIKTDKVCALTSKKPLQSVSLDAYPPPPNPYMSHITLTATPNGGNIVEYQFLVTRAGRGYQPPTVIRDWNTSRACTWHPTEPGQYMLTVKARESYGSPKEVSAKMPYKINNLPLTGVSLTAAPPSPQPVNTAITLKATPIGGSGVSFKFLAMRLGGKDTKWVVIRDYAAARECVWTPLAAGNYSLAVQARNGFSVKPYDVGNMINYTVSPAESTLTLLGDPLSPVYSGTTVTFTATSTGFANPEYRFVLYASATVIELRGWGASGVCTWLTSPLGAYPVEVRVREQGSTVEYSLKKQLLYQVNPAS
jgi:hypothetical protein